MLAPFTGVLGFPQLQRLLSKLKLLKLSCTHESSGELTKRNVLFRYIWDGLQDLAFLISVQVMPVQLVPKPHFEKPGFKERKIAPPLLGDFVFSTYC